MPFLFEKPRPVLSKRAQRPAWRCGQGEGGVSWGSRPPALAVILLCLGEVPPSRGTDTMPVGRCTRPLHVLRRAFRLCGAWGAVNATAGQVQISFDEIAPEPITGLDRLTLVHLHTILPTYLVIRREPLTCGSARETALSGGAGGPPPTTAPTWTKPIATFLIGPPSFSFLPPPTRASIPADDT